jgi:hypothetical protein
MIKLKLVVVFLFSVLMGFGQWGNVENDIFKIQTTNLGVDEMMLRMIPGATSGMNREGVLVFVSSKNREGVKPDAVEYTLRYRDAYGKLYEQKQIGELKDTPNCRCGTSVFWIGRVSVVSTDAQPVVWKAKRVAE